MLERGKFLTFDLGAESGRAVLGNLEAGKIALDEIHRFPNEPQRILDRFHWDTVRLFAEIKIGIAKCFRTSGNPDGIGVDTWGVDFALLDFYDELLGLPYHYRDHRTDGIMEQTFAIVPRDEIYRSTGIQFMQLNTLFQLMAMRFADSPLLDSARSLLFTPDLLNFWLTGRKANEFTIATTSQCYDPKSGDWARPMLERLGLPVSIFGEIVQTGTILGPLHDTVRDETGSGNVPVIAPATHDTGSAVAGVPAEGNSGWAYISCGTWSLVGVEVNRPVIDDRTLEFNLTNEGGVNQTFRLLRNVMGLWLLQQCRRAWEKQGRAYSYQELAAMGESAMRFGPVIDPDDSSFLNPADMPASIVEFCRRTSQEPPNDTAATVRCIVESLALKYRWVIEKLELVTNQKIDRIHIIGGGSQNRELCQAAADASGRTVFAGPVEATALGNILVQAMATGRIGSVDEGRALIRRSFPVTEYRPQNSETWEEPYRRFAGVLSG